MKEMRDCIDTAGVSSSCLQCMDVQTIISGLLWYWRKNMMIRRQFWSYKKCLFSMISRQILYYLYKMYLCLTSLPPPPFNPPSSPLGRCLTVWEPLCYRSYWNRGEPECNFRTSAPYTLGKHYSLILLVARKWTISHFYRNNVTVFFIHLPSQ